MTLTLESKKQESWKAYYEKTTGKPPPALLLKALELLPTSGKRFAIDLGCGSGRASLFLGERGWHVLAIDRDKLAFDYLNDEMRQQCHIETYLTEFEELNLSPYPKAKLIYAGYSLPFCYWEHFHDFWKMIEAQLETEGIIAGQFFGEKHSWCATEDKMVFHTKKEVMSLVHDFAIEYFEEEDKDGVDVLDNPVHWHVFHVIARKKAAITTL